MKDDVEDPRASREKNPTPEVYRLSRAEVLTSLTLLIGLVGGVIHFSRDTSGDARAEANRAIDFCTTSISASEARSRALVTDLETRTTKALGDAEARSDRQISQVAGAIGKRIDANDAQIAQLAKGKRW